MMSLERIFWLYQSLKRGECPSARRYLDHWEISDSTFKRDLAFFRDRLGAPIVYDRSQRGYRLLDDSFELPSFWFNRPQLLMMIGICKQLQQMEDKEDEAHQVRDLRERLQALLTTQDGSAVADLFSFENVEWVRCDCRHLDTIIQAMLERRCLDITYHTARTGISSQRVVEPYRLHNYMGSWYLIGFCRTRKEPRTFQLGRIHDITPLPERYDQPRFDVSAHIDAPFGIFKGQAPRPVVLKFDPFMARFVRQELWHREQEMTFHADGSLDLTLPVADLTEIKMKVLKYGRHVEVVGPDELRRLIQAEAEEVARVYAGPEKTIEA